MAGKKHSATERIGGPGASHEDRKHPERSDPRGQHPTETKSSKRSGVSGGGGEPDSHHTQDPARKGGRRP